MFKFRQVFCALLVGLTVGVAYGAVVKIRALTPQGVGLAECPDADGMAIFNYKTPEGNADPGTDVNVVITDFQPDTVYGVRYENDANTGSEFSIAIATNASGNGHWHDTHPQDVSTNPTVVVYRDSNGNFCCDAGEEQACGGSNCPYACPADCDGS